MLGDTAMVSGFCIKDSFFLTSTQVSTLQTAPKVSLPTLESSP